MNRNAWRAALLYAALTMAFCYPFSVNLTSNLLSHGTDTDLWVWTIGWDLHALLHQPWAIFDANIFFPFRHTLAYSENMIGSALVAAPVVWLTGNLLLGINVVVLVSIAASGIGARLLARRLGLSEAGALIAGLVFAFTPPRFLRLNQMHLTTIQWIPFSLAYLHAYFQHGRPRDLRLALCFFTLQALTSGHGGAFLVLAIVVVFAVRLAQGEPVAFMRRLRDVGVIGALIILPAALIYVPYRAAQVEVGLRRALEGDWGLSASSFFTSSSYVQQCIVKHAPAWDWLAVPPDAWLFPGFLPIALAFVAIVRRPRVEHPRDEGERTADAPGWRAVAAALEMAIVISAGFAVWAVYVGGIYWRFGDVVIRSHGARPWLVVAALVACRLAVLGRASFDMPARLMGAMRSLIQWPLRIPAALRRDEGFWTYLLIALLCLWLAIGQPFGLWRWTYWLPGLNFVRVPSRFMLLGCLALGVLAGLGVDRLTRSASPRRRNVVALVIGALLVAEFAVPPVMPEPFHLPTPAIEAWVGREGRPMSIVDLPVTDSYSVITREMRNTLFMLHSMAHWQPIVEGYSGTQPPGYEDVIWELATFPDEKSLATMRRLGVTHAILHVDLVPPTERAEVEARFARFADRVVLEHVEGDGRLYALR